MEALRELKKMREELQVKVNLLGKDAGDVLREAQAVLELIEAKMCEVRKAARRDAQKALAQVRGRMDALAKKLDGGAVKGARPAEPHAAEPHA